MNSRTRLFRCWIGGSGSGGSSSMGFGRTWDAPKIFVGPKSSSTAWPTSALESRNLSPDFPTFSSPDTPSSGSGPELPAPNSLGEFSTSAQPLPSLLSRAGNETPSRNLVA